MFGHKKIDEKIEKMKDDKINDLVKLMEMMFGENLDKNLYCYQQNGDKKYYGYHEHSLSKRIDRLESHLDLLLNHLGLEVRHEAREEKDVIVPIKRRGRPPKNGK